MVPTNNTVDLAQRLPNSQLVLYPDAGHGGVFQFHQDFVKRALEFLWRTPAPPHTPRTDRTSSISSAAQPTCWRPAPNLRRGGDREGLRSQQAKRPMQVGEVAEPAIDDRDVLVDVHAAGVNMLDAKIRDGEFKLFLPYKAPFILGHDLAGVVTRVGSAVTRFSLGDEVYARPRDGRIGTFAECIAVDEDDLAIKLQPSPWPRRPRCPRRPDRLAGPRRASELAAPARRCWSTPAPGASAPPRSSWPSTWATVTTTTGTSNVEWVRDLGADVVIDYRTEDFETAAHDYDIVLDSQGGDTLAKSLRPEARRTAIGIAGPPDPAFARQKGLRLPLRLAMTVLSLKTRRAARRHGVRYCSCSCAPAAPNSTRSPSSSRPTSSDPSSTGRTPSTRPPSPRPRRRRPDQGQGRHHDGLTRNPCGCPVIECSLASVTG